MKVEALVSFGGRISMYQGEQREIEDKEVLADLLNARYVKEIDAPKANKKTGKKIGKKP